MALLCDVNLDNGLFLKNAYIRIANFQGNEYELSFTMRIYVDENAYKENKNSISSGTYNIQFDKSKNLYNQMYEYLKSLTEFETAVEA